MWCQYRFTYMPTEGKKEDQNSWLAAKAPQLSFQLCHQLVLHLQTGVPATTGSLRNTHTLPLQHSSLGKNKTWTKVPHLSSGTCAPHPLPIQTSVFTHNIMTGAETQQGHGGSVTKGQSCNPLGLQQRPIFWYCMHSVASVFSKIYLRLQEIQRPHLPSQAAVKKTEIADADLGNATSTTSQGWGDLYGQLLMLKGKLSLGSSLLLQKHGPRGIGARGPKTQKFHMSLIKSSAMQCMRSQNGCSRNSGPVFCLKKAVGFESLVYTDLEVPAPIQKDL